MSRVVELKRITGVFRRKGLTILLAGSFVIGLLYGVLLIAQDNAFANEMASLSGMKTGAGEPVWRLFVERLGSLLAFLVIPYFFGFCAVGQPLCCGAVFVKALGAGSFLAGLYQEYAWQGVGYCAVAVIVPLTISFFILLLACRESIRFSNRIFAVALLGKSGNIGVSAIRLYHIKYLFIAGFAVIGALIDVLFTICFANRLLQF